MKEAYVKFSTAKRLKEKGFDWGCCSYWCVFPNGDIVHTDYGHFANHNGNETDRFISRPTQALAYRWLREEKEIHPELELCTDNEFSFTIYKLDGKRTVLYEENHCWTKPEDAVEAALEYVLTNLI